MSPAEKKPPSGSNNRTSGLLGLLLRQKTLVRRAMLVIVAAVVVIFGSRTLWQLVQAHVATQPEYQATVDHIEITPPPAWIHTDLKSEVIRDAGLPEQLSILDERVTDRLTQAFALHPWVARVEKVERSYPNRIRVTLVYREPVAMVEVRGGLLPINAEATLLPPNDFSPDEAENYLRISGVASGPLGPLGTAWGDPAVEAAAKLAGTLKPAWNSLQLRRIRIQNPGGTSTVQNILLELTTRTGTTFTWGSAPDNETPGETTAAEKLARLQRLAADRGSLDAVPADQRDLRRRLAPVAETPQAKHTH